MPALPARMRSGMPSIASAPAATNASSTGGYDALSELVFVGFDSLQASTPEKCRPFDADRTGMVLGEGAALLALENLEAAQARGAKFWLRSPATGSRPTIITSRSRIPPALDRARRWNTLCAAPNLQAEAIDYINAHGTATPFNDAAEGKAIAELFCLVCRSARPRA